MPTTIFTVGHGRAPFQTVLEALLAHGVATLIDIRSHPYSRHAPDFVRRRLEALCAAAGIGYRWMGSSLGGRPTDPSLLDTDGGPDPAAMQADAGFQGALDTVVEVARGGRVALLCAEELPDRCHRATILAPALVERGHRILHLRHDGIAHPHQQTLGLA